MRRILVSVVCVAVLAGVSLAVPVDVREVLPWEEDSTCIRWDNPDANEPSGMTHTPFRGTADGEPSLVMFQFDFSDAEYAGLVPDGDFRFQVGSNWNESTDWTYALHEITGGAWDDDAVTWNNYVGAAGTYTDVLGPELSVNTIPSGGNNYSEFPMPDSVIAGWLANPGVHGVALLRNGQYANTMIYGGGMNWHQDARPQIKGTLVPEPMTMSLLALGGLLALRRRR